jgi:hypothetical protein
MLDGIDQINSNNIIKSLLNIQKIPVEKVHVGDIDIAYKTFGKGEPFLLISGAGMNMDYSEKSIHKSHGNHI